MTVDIELARPLARLAQQFDQNLRTTPYDASQRGWGQFIAAEAHTNQIGLYGTCAGILVKTIADRNAHIDPAVAKYLKDQWEKRTTTAQKYFNQTIRLSFFVLALAQVNNPDLITLRDAAVQELIARQLPDGGWGDWRQEGNPTQAPSRQETTAWATLALSRLQGSDYRSQLQDAADFLQKQILAYDDIKRSVDPIVLAAAIRTLPAKKIQGRTRSAAVSFLADTRPRDELQIYFFDYFYDVEGAEQVKRDYLCVPQFLAYCALAGCANLGKQQLSIEGLRVALADWRARRHLRSVLNGEPLRTPRARFPATVDQSIVALAVEFLGDRATRLGWLFSIVQPLVHHARKSFLCRVAIPLAIITIAGAIAQDPKNIFELTSWASGQPHNDLRKFVLDNASILQATAIGVGFLVGQPMLNTIWQFFRDKWAP